MGISSIILPKVNLAQRVEEGLRLAHTEVQQLKPLFSEGRYIATDMMSTGGMVAPNDANLIRASEVLHNKVFTKAFAPKQLSGDNMPDALAGAAAALDHARAETLVPAKAIKHPEQFTSTPASSVYDALDNLETRILNAHMQVTDQAVIREINSHAPIRKGAALVRLGILSVGASVGGVAVASAITGKDYVTPIVDKGKDTLGV